MILQPARSLAVVNHILGDNLRIKAKELRVCRIDRDAHPMCFRVAEGFNACKVLKPSVGLLAEERLVDTEGVRVTVEERDRLLVTLSASTLM